ncbi:2-oxoglutarate synthase subunit KorA [uncultured archaeon]|nr:2-oxoglutarate synthase subunit KorA [uncultured archaeon]
MVMLNILVGGRAGQGINKVSEIISNVLIKYGYYVFNYRDYPSIIRGGHNFNVLSISDKLIGSHESKVDFVLALDKNTVDVHKNDLKKGGAVITSDEFSKFGLNANVALSAALIKILGIDKKVLFDEVKKEIKDSGSLDAAEAGYNSQTIKFNLKKLNNNAKILDGNTAVAVGARNSKIDIYFSYPMTPTTNCLQELASNQIEDNLLAFQPEGEISAVNMALGASFAGAKVMVGTSGGGFDLMVEALSLQGMSEIPLVVYLGSRGGPSTGLPTYTMQGDLDDALRAGHGEFPRIVIAPGSPAECIEKTNEAFYLSEKFGALSIVLSDKHLAESEFSYDSKINTPLKVQVKRNVPGEKGFVAKASSYEHDEYGLSTEDAKITKENADNRMKKYSEIQKECKKFEMIKIHGKKDSKNLIIGWGSTKGAILDAIEGQDYKFLQVLYMKPLSDEIKKEMLKAKKIILVENNLTGQLGKIIREKTGLKIENRILKYDGRPFTSDELKEKLEEIK